MRCEIGFACMLVLLAAGCDDKRPVDPVDPDTIAAANTGVSGAGPVTQTTAPAAVPQEMGDDFGAFADAAWCPRAYDDTIKIVEGMKETMKLAGKDSEVDEEFAPPEKSKYLELCGKLPLEMQKCLVVGWAAKNRDACQSELEGLDDGAKAAYGELMGK